MKHKKTIKYFIVGGISFAIEYTSFLVIAYLLGAPAWVAQFMSYTITLVFNFLLLRYWAFSAHAESSWTQISKYILLVAVNLPLTTFIINLLVDAHIEPFIAKIIVILLAALWNFLIYNKLIFHTKG